jgi:hypothetical protein
MIKFCINFTLLFLSVISFSQNAVIRGKILDATDNSPLPFVNVIITGTTTGVVTDNDGNFILSGLKPGYVSLTASFIGYETTVSRDVLVSNAKVAYVEITLPQSSKQIDEVVVKTSYFKKTEESPLSLKSIGLTEIESNPGSNRDISKVIQSFPGVGASTISRNDIIIRGGGPSESRFFLDGVEIPYLNHFATQGASGGSNGIINADFISGVNFYSGAFPASRGNALSGVFDFTQINGNHDKIKTRASLGASDMSITLDGPLGEKSDFIVSFRRSYLKLLFSMLGLPFLPTYNDYQLKYRYKIGKKDEFTLISIGALDLFKLNTGIKSPTPEQEYLLTSLPIYKQWSYTIGGVYKHFGKHTSQTIVVSRNMLNNVIYKYPNNDQLLPKSLDYLSQEMENKMRYEITARISNVKLSYGLSSEYAQYTNNTNQVIPIAGQDVNIAYKSAIDFLKYGAFIQSSTKFFNEQLTLSFGARVDGSNFDKSMQNLFNQFSPRLSASYQLSEKFSINANTGRYYQLPAYTTLGFKDGDVFVNKQNNISYISVNHAIAGLEYRFNENTQFTIEGYYKLYGHYPTSTKDSVSLATQGAQYGTVGSEAVLSNGKGRAYGIELMNRIRTKNFNSTLSLTIGKSEFENKGIYIPTTWDSRYILIETATAKLKHNWNLGFKWRLVGGLPYTPYDLQQSSYISYWDVYGTPKLNNAQINSQRFKAFHQLDIRIDKQYFYNKWSLMMYIDIQNLYNDKGQSQDIVVADKDIQGNALTTNNGQQYVLKSYTNTTGTVLPTIGIMLEF